MRLLLHPAVRTLSRFGQENGTGVDGSPCEANEDYWSTHDLLRTFQECLRPSYPSLTGAQASRAQLSARQQALLHATHLSRHPQYAQAWRQFCNAAGLARDGVDALPDAEVVRLLDSWRGWAQQQAAAQGAAALPPPAGALPVPHLQAIARGCPGRGQVWEVHWVQWGPVRITSVAKGAGLRTGPTWVMPHPRHVPLLSQQEREAQRQQQHLHLAQQQPPRFWLCNVQHIFIVEHPTEPAGRDVVLAVVALRRTWEVLAAIGAGPPWPPLQHVMLRPRPGVPPLPQLLPAAAATAVTHGREGGNAGGPSVKRPRL